MGARLFTGQFGRLWVFGFITFFSAFQLFPVIPFRILELGRSKAEAGLFLSFYTMACAFSAPVTGSLADALGRRRVLVAGSVFFIVFSLLYGVVRQLPLLLAVAAVHGVFWSGLLASSGALISDVIPASRRTEGIAYWGMASTIAASVAPAVGLWIFHRAGWFEVCLGMAALSASMALLASRLERDPGARAPRVSGLGQVLPWRVMAVSLAFLPVSFGYGGIMSYVALMSIERKIVPSTLFFTVFASAVLVFRLLLARTGDRIGPRALLLPCLLLIPPALLCLALAKTQFLLVLGALVMGAGFGGAYPGFAAFLLGRTPPERRAATFGSLLWAFDSGIALGSLVTGFLVEHHGFRAAFLCGAGLAVLAVPIFLLTSPLLPAAGASGGGGPE
ncbi:MAG: MFS transporter [Thermoanaerobaculia bacterium]|nr:hypothetical protein [Thermoanaerobaculia bacterium]MCK6685609.1 MFS transporter [Thermoanaerobaculia bacterium]